MGIGVAVAVVAAGLGFAINKAIKHKVARRLGERESLSDEDIYQRFYASSGYERDTLAELWHEIARELHAPPEKMRPEDVFGKDVGVCWLKCREMDALHVRVVSRLQTLGLALDPSSLTTVDAYVRCFANKHEKFSH